MKEKKLVLFGAGKIGRSFIGQVFSRSGYEVVFVDINQELIDRLNLAGTYQVIVKSEQGDEVIRVDRIRGIAMSQSTAIAEELSGASIAAVSVGQQGLPATIPIIAKSLLLRRQKHGQWPLDIIIAENMRNADDYIRQELLALLPGYPIDSMVGLVETSIGKMVPIMTRKDMEEDMLQVFAEPYNNLIVSKNGFKNQVPSIEFLSPKENIKAWVDRKLFIHNLGHATAAYLGNQARPEAVYIYEILENRDVYERTRLTMLESAAILMALYPGEFTEKQLNDHIDDLLFRFKNKALGDTIFRVGCDLFRKLGPEDRLAGPVHAAKNLNMPFGLILEAIKAAIAFSATDESGRYFPDDEQFFLEARHGEGYILKNICKLSL